VITKLDRLDDSKVLIYSHDSFGLGHLRRCRTIAHSLVDTYKGISVLIISGSPMISQFDFKSRVSFITVPGVVKLRNGDYTSLGLHVDLGETMAMRASMIQHSAEVFAPDIFIVDKEPLGLRGEVENTLRWLKMKGATNVLGLRDVMDDSEALQNEWQRKNVVPALEKLYDELWIYGSESIGNPIQGIELTDAAHEKMHYLGYLKRTVPDGAYLSEKYSRQKYILVTSGGGGDGELLVDWILRAYEHADDPELVNCVIMLGPFMSKSAQLKFKKRASKISKIETRVFDNEIEMLMTHAEGIVAMGGYNTFCEILSFDKKSIIVPRETPRLEQRIRADFASKRNLVSMLLYKDSSNTEMMIEALKNLPTQTLPSTHGSESLLNGLEQINVRVEEILSRN
jgi:predicted glycosyltransferase